MTIETQKRESMESTGRQSLMDRGEVLQRRETYWAARRAQDIVLCLVALLVLWPGMLLIAILIVIDSPQAGPIFVQDRIGRDGKVFPCYKFRSMIPGAEAQLEGLVNKNEMSGPVFKIKEDPRITRIGKFIRKTSIDELPQIFNVLKGEMSIVGPRPALPREVAQYGEYEKQRLFVTPGMTCYWQIQPHRNDMSFEQWLELDLKYIRECGILDDWVVIFKTIGAVLRMNGQ